MISKGAKVLAILTVTDVDHIRARIGIDADESIDINREPIFVAKFGKVKEFEPHWH